VIHKVNCIELPLTVIELNPLSAPDLGWGSGSAALLIKRTSALSTWARTEIDAVPSVFSYSDFGRNGDTNVMGHFIGLEYVLMPRLTLSVKNHFVNFIDRPGVFTTRLVTAATERSAGILALMPAKGRRVLLIHPFSRAAMLAAAS
jgi:hypothetical protein